MISAYVNLHTGHSIDTPINLRITYDIMYRLGIADTTPLEIGESNRKTMYLGGEVVNNIDNNTSYLQTISTATLTPGKSLLGTVRNNTENSIYLDTDIEASVYPVYQPYTFTFNMKYYNKSLSKVKAMKHTLELLVANNGLHDTHSINYSYNIPPNLMILLYELYTLKEENISFEDYITNTFNNHSYNISENNYKDIAITNRQYVVGKFISNLDDITISDDDNGYSIEFEYNIELDYITKLIVNYPILVYNKYIGELYDLVDDSKTLDKISRRPSDQDIYDLTKNMSYITSNNKQYLTSPLNDTQTLPEPPTGYKRVFSVMIQVDSDNPHDICNLKEDLDGFSLKPSVLDLLVSEGTYVSKVRNSIFYLDLYSYNKRVYNEVYVNPNGDVLSKYPLDIKGLYRVGFNICIDTTILYNDGKNRLDEFIRNDSNLLNRYVYEDFSISKQIEKDDSFGNLYVDLLNIEETDIRNAITNTVSVSDLVFKVSTPEYAKTKIVATYNTTTLVDI